MIGLDEKRLYVSPEERRRAHLMDADRNKFHPRGVNVAAIVAQRATVELLKAYRGKRDESLAFLKVMLTAAPALSEALVLAHLFGRRRARLSHPKQEIWSPSVRLSVSTPIKFLTTRMEMPLDELKLVQQTYDAHALRIMQDVSEDVEKALQSKLIEINRQGMHVREGAKELQRTLHAHGVSHVKPYRLEEVFRTQTQMAYSAGRWEMDQDPAIQEILWGYKYVAVGDDRTRETHLTLNGVQAPKTDPIWGTIWTPNGYNCRCQIISIFDERKSRLPPNTLVDSKGRTIPVRPDKGFLWNPGQVFQPLFGKSYENWLKLNAEGLGTMILKAKGVMPREYWVARYQKFLKAQGLPPTGTSIPIVKTKPPSLEDILKVLKPEQGPKFIPGPATKQQTKEMLEGLIEIDKVKILGADLGVPEKYVRDALKDVVRASGKPLNLKKVLISYGPKPGNKLSLGTFNYNKRTLKLWKVGKQKKIGPITIGDFNVGNDLAATIRHEAGHAIQRTIDMDEWYKIYNTKIPKQWSPLVSEYGGSLRNELWAESVSVYSHPEYIRGQLPKIIEDFMDSRFRKKLGKVPIKIPQSPSLKGVEVDTVFEKHLAHYAETVDDIHVRFPTLSRPQIRTLVIEDVSIGIETGVEGSFTEGTRKLKLSAKREIKGVLELGGEEVWTVDTSYSGLVRHEYGHSLQKELLDSQWDDIYRSRAVGRWADDIGEYAAENSKELWAESFSAYTHPKYQRGMLPKQIEQYLDRKFLKTTVIDTRPIVKVPSMDIKLRPSGSGIPENSDVLKWKKALSKDEREAIRDYTRTSYADIRALELGRPFGPTPATRAKVTKLRDDLYAALDKAPKAEGEALRAIPRFRDEAAAFKRYEVGNTVEVKSLQSATYDVETFGDFLSGARRVTAGGGDPVVFKYQLRGHGGGAAIEVLSSAAGESEILVRAGARFRVKSVKHNVVHKQVRGISYSEITLEELPLKTTVIDTRVTTTVVDTRPIVKIPEVGQPLSSADEIRAWTKTVTAAEDAGFDLFTGNGFDVVRALDRGQTLTKRQLTNAADTMGRVRVTAKQLQKLTDDMYAALDRAPRLTGNTSRAIPRFRDEAEFKRYKVGNTVEIDALSSSTYDAESLGEFLTDAQLLTGKDPVVFRYKLRGHGGGISIESISASEHELEIAIRKGARFKVTKVNHKVVGHPHARNVSYSEIFLEELPAGVVKEAKVWPSKSYEGWLKANAEGTGPMTLKSKGLMPPDYWIERYDKFLKKADKKPSGLGVKKPKPLVSQEPVVAVGDVTRSKAVKAWAKDLTPAEDGAIQSFVVGDFAGIQATEQGLPLTENMKALGRTQAYYDKKMADLHAAFDKAPQIEGTVFRRSEIKFVDREVGEVFEFKATRSGSRSLKEIQTYAEDVDYPVVMRLKLNGQRTLLPAEVLAIEDKEVVIRQGAKFRVTAKKQKKLYLEITYEEIEEIPIVKKVVKSRGLPRPKPKKKDRFELPEEHPTGEMWRPEHWGGLTSEEVSILSDSKPMDFLREKHPLTARMVIRLRQKTVTAKELYSEVLGSKLSPPVAGITTDTKVSQPLGFGSKTRKHASQAAWENEIRTEGNRLNRELLSDWTFGNEIGHEIKIAEQHLVIGKTPLKGTSISWNSLLDEAPQFKGTTYRGMDFSAFHNRDDWIKQFTTKDGIVQFDASSSMSKNRETAAFFSRARADFAARGSENPAVVFKIKSHSGVDISQLGVEVFRGQEEVIARAGTKYRVVKVQKNVVMKAEDYATHNGKRIGGSSKVKVTYVELEELPATVTKAPAVKKVYTIDTPVPSTAKAVKTIKPEGIHVDDVRKDKTITKWLRNMSEDEVNAVQEFTQALYTGMQAVERGVAIPSTAGKVSRKLLERTVRDLHKAFDNAPKIHGTVYRGGQLDPSMLKVGNTFELGATRSASRVRKIALDDFAQDKKNPVLMKVNLKGRGAGMSVERFSGSAAEKEVMLRSKSVFKITKVEQKTAKWGKYTEVTFDEVGVNVVKTAKPLQTVLPPEIQEAVRAMGSHSDGFSKGVSMLKNTGLTGDKIHAAIARLDVFLDEVF